MRFNLNSVTERKGVYDYCKYYGIFEVACRTGMWIDVNLIMGNLERGQRHRKEGIRKEQTHGNAGNGNKKNNCT